MILPELALVRYLYILPPFHLKAVSPRNSHPCDPLDIFATSHLPPNLSRMRSGINPEDNSRRPSTRITQPSSTPSSAVNTHPRNLKNTNWWTILTDRAVSLIVDVPLAHGKERSAAVSALKGNSGYRVDEDFDSYPLSPTLNPKSQHPSTAANMSSREHGSGLLCFCF